MGKLEEKTKNGDYKLEKELKKLNDKIQDRLEKGCKNFHVDSILSLLCRLVTLSPMADNDIQMNESGKSEVSTKTVMGVLSYIGPLVIVSYIVMKDDSFVKFHIKQGLTLLVLEVAIWVIVMMMPLLWPLAQITNIAILILAIVGIVNVVKNKENPLPLIGGFSKHFPI